MDNTALLLRPVAVVRSAKVVIAGGLGAGKTTFVEAASDVVPLTTEALMSAGEGIGGLSSVSAKQTTTVAIDFGRVDLDGISLYLFGTPGQPKSWFMWNRITLGALGAVVLADTRRLADCFGAIDYFEHLRLPYVVVINKFDTTAAVSPAALRHALTIGAEVPLLVCDGRVHSGVRRALIQLLEHLSHFRSTGSGHRYQEAVKGFG